MYTKKVKVGKSKIEGKGLFAEENIKKGEIVWIYKEGHDYKLTPEEFEQLSEEEKEEMYKVAYLSPWTGLWVSPPKDDLARFTNHSPNNNLTVLFNAEISDEPYFVANRDIVAGEEVTNNYYEFDSITQETKPDWAK